MTQSLDLKELERRAWMLCCSEDGLFDIFIGLMMLTVGVRALTDNVWYTLGMGVALVVHLGGKKLISTPRIGRVRFGPIRKVRQRIVMAVVVMSVVATLALLTLTLLMGAPSRAVMAPLIGIWFAVFFGLLAHYMDFGRLYAYGVLFAISLALTEAYDNALGPIASAVSGGIVLLIGLVVFIRFLGKYRMPGEEALDVTA